jgi:hypothetical protein
MSGGGRARAGLRQRGEPCALCGRQLRVDQPVDDAQRGTRGAREAAHAEALARAVPRARAAAEAARLRVLCTVAES